MIDFIRLYVDNRYSFEKRVLNDGDFKNITRLTDVLTETVLYPIKSENDGINIEIDEYHGFFIGIPIIIYNNYGESKKINSVQNLTYTQLCFCIRKMMDFMKNNEKFTISQIQIGITIISEISGKDIIKNNLLMHKYKYYNHDQIPNKNKEIKMFDYTNFTIELIAENKKEDKLGYLKIKLKLKKSYMLKKLRIIEITDLLDKEKLEKLFALLKAKFEELQIVDSVETNNIINEKDRQEMTVFLKYGYWSNLSKNSPKQTIYNKKKKFESLLEKYNLNTIKEELSRSIDEAFNSFLKE